MQIYLGVITKILDNLKFVIEFSIKGYIEARTAYPIDLSDQPVVGETVVLYEIDNSILGYSYLYMNLRLDDYTKISIGENMIQLKEDAISILTKKGTIDVNSQGDINIQSKGNIKIDGQGVVTIAGGTIKMEGTALPGDGPFCCIKTCPVTGLPHTGNIVM